MTKYEVEKRKMESEIWWMSDCRCGTKDMGNENIIRNDSHIHKDKID
jgi:hypothetical protein